MRTSLLALVVLAPACTVPNPNFDLPSGLAGSDGEPTSAADPTTGGVSTPQPGTTDEPAGTTDPTTGPEPTDPTDTKFTTTVSDDTGTTGDPVATCWDQGVQGWPLAGAALTEFADKDPRDPWLGPDGLRIYYIAHATRRPFVSTRAKPGDPFPNGVQVGLWGQAPDLLLSQAAATLDVAELYFGAFDDLYVATYKGGGNFDQYEVPVPVPGVNGPHADSHPRLTADGTLLLLQRSDGPPHAGVLAEHTWRFWQYTRPEPTPGGGFAGGVDVTPPLGVVPLALCPALAPDGLHLFFTGTDVELLTLDNVHDATAIYYTRRPGVDAPWEPPQRISQFSGEGSGVMCPGGVSADGCALSYSRFEFGRTSAEHELFLAERTP
jgi:hypothetical protein